MHASGTYTPSPTNTHLVRQFHDRLFQHGARGINLQKPFHCSMPLLFKSCFGRVTYAICVTCKTTGSAKPGSLCTPVCTHLSTISSRNRSQSSGYASTMAFVMSCVCFCCRAEAPRLSNRTRQDAATGNARARGGK